MLVQFQMIEEFLQLCDRQIYQFGNVFSTHPDISGFRFQASAVAFRAKCLSAVTCQHYPILYLILILFQHLEEIIDAMEILIAFPK